MRCEVRIEYLKKEKVNKLYLNEKRNSRGGINGESGDEEEEKWKREREN